MRTHYEAENVVKEKKIILIFAVVDFEIEFNIIIDHPGVV